jgi:hypothetical protein
MPGHRRTFLFTEKIKKPKIKKFFTKRFASHRGDFRNVK